MPLQRPASTIAERMGMSVHAQQQIGELKNDLDHMGQRVREALRNAVDAAKTLDGETAEAIRKADSIIDQMELRIQRQCQDILTLEQPLAKDLRFVISVLRINTDLERMADQALNIAEQVPFLLAAQKRVGMPVNLEKQALIVVQMVEHVAECLVKLDAAKAKQIMDLDDQVDQLHGDMHHTIEEAVVQEPTSVAEMVSYLKISRELERIADHAVNICEEIIFIVSGKTTRHSRRT